MTWTTSLRRRLWTSAKAKSLPTSQRQDEVGRRPDCSSRAGEDHGLRDKEHTRFVSRQPCVVCGRTRRLTRTIFVLPSPAHSDERPATNTRSPSVAHIIANCIATATRHRGGRESTSIPFRSRSRYGKERAPTGSWNQRPGTRGKSSSLVQSGQAIHRNLERRAEGPRLISFCRRGLLKAY
jgi:hypothetical protein